MTAKQFIKWRKDVLNEKHKYCPKWLIPYVLACNVGAEKRKKVIKHIKEFLKKKEKEVLFD